MQQLLRFGGGEHRPALAHRPLHDPAGGLERPLPIPIGGSASYSPDGKSLAYTYFDREFRTWKRYQGGRNQDVWTFDLEAMRSRRLVDWPGSDNFPMWHGGTIYFTSDRDRTMNLFAADVATVGVTGAVLVGRDQALEASRTLFGGPLADQYARYEIDDVRFLGPDVAIVRKLARAIDDDGTPIDVDHAMVAHYVLARDGDRWWVVLRQNTLIAR